MFDVILPEKIRSTGIYLTFELWDKLTDDEKINLRIKNIKNSGLFTSQDSLQNTLFVPNNNADDDFSRVIKQNLNLTTENQYSQSDELATITSGNTHKTKLNKKYSNNDIDDMNNKYLDNRRNTHLNSSKNSDIESTEEDKKRYSKQSRVVNVDDDLRWNYSNGSESIYPETNRNYRSISDDRSISDNDRSITDNNKSRNNGGKSRTNDNNNKSRNNDNNNKSRANDNNNKSRSNDKSRNNNRSKNNQSITDTDTSDSQSRQKNQSYRGKRLINNNFSNTTNDKLSRNINTPQTYSSVNINGVPSKINSIGDVLGVNPNEYSNRPQIGQSHLPQNVVNQVPSSIQNPMAANIVPGNSDALYRYISALGNQNQIDPNIVAALNNQQSMQMPNYQQQAMSMPIPNYQQQSIPNYQQQAIPNYQQPMPNYQQYAPSDNLQVGGAKKDPFFFQ